MSDDTAGGLEKYHDPAGQLLAMVVRRDFRGGKYNFFTPDDFPLQMGTSFYMSGERITPHIHIPQPRQVDLVNEYVYVKSGRLELTLYTKERVSVTTITLETGDSLLLTGGGHGFKVLEECQLIEVKQGPYLGMDDKVKFE
ncbi:MAG: hypothetical protein FJ034_05400 [Chloroflexi bacterium]|nr:hypothetical protein [Chloroflexota bacterium]